MYVIHEGEYFLLMCFDQLDALTPCENDSQLVSSTHTLVIKALLKQTETLNACKGGYVIGTTNRLDLIDSVKCSLGRFSKTFFRDLLNGNGKREILKVITKKTIFTNQDLRIIAEYP